MRRSKKDRRGSDTNNKVDPEDQTNTIPDVVQEVPEGLESTAKKNDRKVNLQKPQFNQLKMNNLILSDNSSPAIPDNDSINSA